MEKKEDKNGRVIEPGQFVKIGHFTVLFPPGDSSDGPLFIVFVENLDHLRLVSDYDISPDSRYWSDYERSDNVFGRPSGELEIITDFDEVKEILQPLICERY